MFDIDHDRLILPITSRVSHDADEGVLRVNGRRIRRRLDLDTMPIDDLMAITEYFRTDVRTIARSFELTA